MIKIHWAPLLCGRSLLHELLFFVTKLSPSFILLSLLIVLYRQYVFKCTIYIFIFTAVARTHNVEIKTKREREGGGGGAGR